MNWLAEYFTQRTSPLNLSLWAYPPLTLGPDGPAAEAPYALPYPGVTLAHTAAAQVKRGDLTEMLPARYDLAQPLTGTGLIRDERSARFFRDITIYAPSRFNPNLLIVINDTLSFVPVFSSEGAPGFHGCCVESGAAPVPASHMRLPWTFQGYISI